MVKRNGWIWGGGGGRFDAARRGYGSGSDDGGGKHGYVVSGPIGRYDWDDVIVKQSGD